MYIAQEVFSLIIYSQFSLVSRKFNPLLRLPQCRPCVTERWDRTPNSWNAFS
jgi:hypothetical protein